MIFREKRMSAFIMAKNMFDSPVHKAFSEIYGSSLAYALVLYLNFSEYLSLNEICDLSNNDMEDLLKVINNYEELGDDVDYKKNIRRYFKRTGYYFRYISESLINLIILKTKCY